jgi:hypothetical protein
VVLMREFAHNGRVIAMPNGAGRAVLFVQGAERRGEREKGSGGEREISNRQG